jgi:hypothetical protein
MSKTKEVAEPHELVQDTSLHLTEVKAVWNIDDGEPGVIRATAKVIDAPLVELKLEWLGHSDDPYWAINWVHLPDYLLSELPEYLRKYHRLGEQMVEVIQSLGLDRFETLDE